MVIELAWRLFFVNYLTDGDDNLRKVGKRENGDLRSIGVIAGSGLRDGCFGVLVVGFGLRVAGYGLRVAGCVLGVTGCGVRVPSCGSRVAGNGLRNGCFGLRGKDL